MKNKQAYISEGIFYTADKILVILVCDSQYRAKKPDYTDIFGNPGYFLEPGDLVIKITNYPNIDKKSDYVQIYKVGQNQDINSFQPLDLDILPDEIFNIISFSKQYMEGWVLLSQDPEIPK